MDLIIRLIMRIFEQVFEKDFERRMQKQEPKGGGTAQKAKPQPALPPQTQQPLSKQPKSLEEWLKLIIEGDSSPEPKKRVRIPPVKPEQPEPYQVHQYEGQPSMERLSDHLRETEERLQSIQREMNEVAQHTSEHLARTGLNEVTRHTQERLGGITEYGVTDHVDPLEVLPGRSPLEQMIYAGVILGPCKGRLGYEAARRR